MKVSLALRVALAASWSRLAAADEQDDLDLLALRRVADLAQFPDPPQFDNVEALVDSQKSDGTWDGVNYASGCPAQRANWPIQEHWNRVITLAAAWGGKNPVSDRKWVGDDEVLDAVKSGMDYWFKNDYTPDDCIGDGGNSKLDCPCGTPGLWNSNWYDQAILIPQLSSTACLLVKDADLTEEQRSGCIRITQRTYDRIDGTYGSAGRLTAANIVLVMQSSVNLGLFTDNATIVADSMQRAFKVMTFSDEAGSDGIHRDGTFLQHDGVLYNGNYGKDLFNIFIQLEGTASGTRFAAGAETRETMATYTRGNEWMIFVDETTKRQLWDYNAVGRFVAFPTSDLQANSDINFNITKLATATADFDGPDSVKDTLRRLASNGTEKLIGNKGFWASDYMSHRRDAFIIGNKMLSKRSTNSETVNSANPYAYQLGQGTLFTYVDGTEYMGIMASWDWSLIPGTTVVHNKPDVYSTSVKRSGKTDFVGVVSDGKVGTAVEDYIDPATGVISYKKAWFHVGEAVVVVTTDIKTNNAGDSPVITVLENRHKADRGAYVDGKKLSLEEDVTVEGSTLFYGGNGYVSYAEPFDLTVSEAERTGNWSAISTSNAGKVTTPIFSAYTAVTGSNASYAIFPASSRHKIEKEAKDPTWKPIIGNGISGVQGSDTLSLVFWPGGEKSMTLDLKDIGWAERGKVTVTSDEPAVYLFTARCKKPGRGVRLVMSAAEPTQKLSSLGVKLHFENMRLESTGDDQQSASASQNEVAFSLSLPGGGLAGSTVKRDFKVLTG